MTFKRAWAVGGLALLTAAAPSMAQDSASRTIERMGRPLYVAPMLNFTIDDSDRATKNGYGASFGVGTRVLPWLAAEVHASYTRFNDDNDLFTGVNTNGRSYSANLLAFPLSGSFRNLFVLAGAGYNEFSSHPETVGPVIQLRDYDSTVYDLGLGLLSGFRLFGSPAAMRVEAKYRFDDHGIDTLGSGGSSDFGDVVISTGLMIPLFYSPPPPPPPPPAPEVVPPVVPADSDGDGVPDDRDQCPNTPAGVEVDNVGCPVPLCVPDGQNGEIELGGCRVGDVVVLSGVKFEFDSDRLTVPAKGILTRVVAALESADNINVEVGGHTDSRGDNAYNQRLSQRRAAAVRAFLVDAGIAANRLTEAGYGEDKPIADNETDEGREENRRVELTVR